MVDKTKPHITYHPVPGGNRNGYPLGEAWSIVVKGLPKTTENQAGEQMIEILGQSEGVQELRRRMEEHGKEKGLEIDFSPS